MNERPQHKAEILNLTKYKVENTCEIIDTNIFSKQTMMAWIIRTAMRK